MSSIVRFMKLDRFEPNRIVTSNLVSPKVLAAVRFVELLYVSAAMISVWATASSAGEYFRYFTNLTYFGLFSYLLASTIWSFGYLRQPVSERAQWVKLGNPWWGRAHWLLYSTVATYSIVVPIVFWTLLTAGMSSWSSLTWYQNLSVHALDGLFGAIVELTLNRHFLQPIHSVFVAVVMVFYMFLTFVVHKTQGLWVYPFLDWSQGPIAAAYYIGIAVGLFIIYFISLLIHKYRNKAFASRSIVVNGDLDSEYREYGDKMETV
ncbi:hypothetical protein EMPS_07908 [Entomortierella parvispora]|uniref:Uncharacterized protein n=1 Tax=Entomortierella parvispora TaxID=205924 RepID=A0A9P3LZ45_9FUNG|nr:hypothetical protein EMPS_07908 [Entomortierella parvispora]